MTHGRLAIDFGNANTVVAIYDEKTKQATAVKLDPFTRLQQWQDELIPVIPSLIHYKPDGSYLIGNEVLQANLAVHEHTFIALKTSFDTIHSVKVGNLKVTTAKAAQDFLTAILKKALAQYRVKKDEAVVFSVPVDTFEKYSKWLTDLALQAGIRNCRFIDEPAAAALSLNQSVKHNQDYLIFDFGAGSLDVAIVRFKFEEKSPSGKHCKVLGKKSIQLGGNNIDQWITQQFFEHNKMHAGSDLAQMLKITANQEATAAKEKLSFDQTADIAVTDHKTGKAFSMHLTRDRFIELLEKNEFFAKVDRTIHAAEAVANHDYAYKRPKLSSLFMVGGTSIIPELQRHLRRGFGMERVHISRPLDAIATGAAAFAAGATLYDHVQHDYAVEVVNLQKKKKQMKVIIQRGEKFPSDEPVATEILKAVNYGQTKFQLFIYEISKEEVEPGSEFIDLDIVEKEDVVLRYVCLNKSHPTLLQTQRPIMHDHPALQIDFRIDENKHLVIDTYRFETDEVKVADMKGVIVVRLT